MPLKLYEDAAAEDMALTSSTETQSPAKKFRCSHTFSIDEIASKFEKKEKISSVPFFCHQDAASPAFAAEIKFGSHKEGRVSAYGSAITSDVQMTWLRFLFHDHDWKLLESRSSTNKIEMKAPNWGWLGCTSGDELNWTEQIGLHVTVEVEYEAHVASTPPLKGRLSEDFLLKFDDEDDKDVTFLVKKEKIKAHKVILSARCPYLKTMFKSGMEESVTNEVEVPDIAPEVFKEMLKFLYCDVAPEYHEDISAGLLVAAERYGLEELKKRCESALTSHLDAENVVEFLLLADDHNCPTLLEKASLVLRSQLQSIATERMKTLERNPALLRKLLMLGY